MGDTKQLDQLSSDLDFDLSQHEGALAAYVERLQKVALEIDFKLRRARTALNALKGHGVPDANDEAKINRMSSAEARQRRAEAGAAIYALMSLRPKNTLFSFGDLQQAFSPTLAFAMPKIVAEWNESHPKQQIKNNGGAKSGRRYFL